MVHVGTDLHTSPSSISTGVSFLQEKASYIQIQIQFITTLMHQYISGKSDIQTAIECWAYQQTHHKALTDSDLTDTACTAVNMYTAYFFVGHSRVHEWLL